jgi:hypothetical protein
MKAVWISLSGAVLLAAGCVNIGQKAHVVTTYMLSAERDIPPVAAPLGGHLGFDRVIALAPYGSRTFTIQRSETTFDSTYYDELLVSPTENLHAIFVQWFSESGLFESSSVSRTSSDQMRMEVLLERLLIDQTVVAQPQAVLGLTISLRGVDGAMIHTESYQRRIDLERGEINEAVAGWNTGLIEILHELERDLIKAMEG